MSRRALLAGSLALPSIARAAPPLRIGVLTTLSGPAADGAGSGSVLAARMALEAWPDLPATLVAADMGERPDIGAAIARAWFDQDALDVVVDVPNSATALAVAAITRERDRVALFSGPGTTLLTGAQCSPNHLQWTYDTAALAVSTGRAVLDEGGDTWFFLTADYVFGHGLQRDITAVVERAGGRVLGSAAFPNETADFSPLLLQARASGARVVALACTGAPFETLVKQAAEFGLAHAGQRLASPLCLLTNVHAIGLDAAQGLLVTEPFYWDLTPATRAFAAKFAPRNRGIPPTIVHAGVFSAVNHLLRTVATNAGAARGAALVAAMQRTPADDDLFGPSLIRSNGAVAHPMHLF
ncbi:MAG TPA: ABC transporter substrate-binding protein, partial [Acetobacteraceae bacterium]|nr:ABC transporter substrate-binding protein [Acetobacteraceae bacterium]